ncbi:hypothetical protein NPX13_g5291 [Xylaria arbuscula]|uniref:AMP-dependent synthetase/ligase domain-containing protein n=1 Tax=Xylaria arbuscula TaxID=114810 RepID=A0A9W8NF39_9PEZI|nr:hypothetical protein NPX13_g5291 [Xylaria arbuscula]
MTPLSSSSARNRSTSDGQGGGGNLSIVHGRRDVPLKNLDLGSLIRNQAKVQGNRLAAIAPYPKALTRWTYRELEEHSNALGKALLSSGVSKGDRVGIFAGNRLEYCALVFAAGRIGAILVVLNTTYTPSELHRALKHTECKVLFLSTDIGRGDTGHFKFIYDAPDLTALRTFVLLDDDENRLKARCVRYKQFQRLSTQITDEALEVAEQKVDPHDVCNLQFTSGTTGNPKAVMLEHLRAMLPDADVSLRRARHRASNGHLPRRCRGLPEPILRSCSRDTQHSERALHIIDGGPDYVGCVSTTSEARVGILGGKDWDLRRLVCAAAAHGGYPEKAQGQERGMTETSPIAFMTNRSDTIEKQLTTVGRVLPHTSAKVVDAKGRIVPIGHKGEVCFAGYLLQKGYWRDREQTAKAMKRDESGVLWMHSGDEGSLDEDGYCTVTGRIKDIIIRGGENIYPSEIEERLMQHPAIASAAVIGVKDTKYGETVGTFLEARNGADRVDPEEIRAWVRGQLAYHKAPLHVFWVGKGGSLESFPVTGSGKVQKEKLREVANSLVHGNRKSSKL